MMQKKWNVRLLIVCAAVLAAFTGYGGNALAQDEELIGEPGRSADGKNPLKNVYFGEQYMHTQNSFDAFSTGTRQTWAEAYRYAHRCALCQASRRE